MATKDSDTNKKCNHLIVFVGISFFLSVSHSFCRHRHLFSRHLLQCRHLNMQMRTLRLQKPASVGVGTTRLYRFANTQTFTNSRMATWASITSNSLSKPNDRFECQLFLHTSKGLRSTLFHISNTFLFLHQINHVAYMKLETQRNFYAHRHF